MRHTLYLSILVLSLVTACTKEADMNIAKESEHTVKKNLFRVTRIEGHNDHWGALHLDYKLQQGADRECFPH